MGVRTHLITPPSIEPVTLAEARMHLRNPEITIDDDAVLAMIKAARGWAEQKTGLRLVTQTVDVYYDEFPCGYYDSWTYEARPAQIELPFRPVQSVTSITYRSSGVATAIDPSVYELEVTDMEAVIKLAYNKSWPSTGPIVVRVIAGWADPDQVPEEVKQWMKLAIEAMDKHRGLMQDREPFYSPYADRLLDRYKVPAV